ncbi:MAG: hypothetical protein AMK75_07105 [Planctomycetes bacterium SM23_65]|nr:MAG: hypothetical protein AMK75_07105 [Planctomycetes bacterium SM23_65]
MTQLKPFGQVAIQMGFVTESQVQAALEIQESMEKTRKERRLLGMIMLEMGMISTEQLIDILKYYETLGHAEGAPEQTDPAASGEADG